MSVPPPRLTIVGTATLPAVGGALSLHPSMGTGAIISPGIEPPAFRRFLTSRYRALNGPKMAFVRLRAGVSPAQGLASLRRIARAGTRALFALPNQAGGGGIPLGIALGRWLWILFAHEIYAVPRPTVPVPLVVYVGLGALVLANAVAALPARYAARTPAALVLRAE